MVTALIRSKELRKRRYPTLVLCLGFGDGLVSIGAILWLINQITGSGSSISCGISMCLLTVGVFMSVHVTFIICLNRYLTTLRSHMADKLYGTYRKFLLIFVPSTVITILTMASSLLWEEEVASCSIANVFGDQMPVYSIFLTAIYLPTLFATVVVYVLTTRVVIRQFGRIDASNNGHFTLPDSSRKRKMTVLKTVGLILACLLFLTTPLVVSFPLMLLNVSINQTVRVCFTWGVTINSAINPIIYTCRIEEIRKDLKKTVLCFYKKD
ncbi:hypothetical protein FSP39_000670 [Pinctada imbricata]|uniref:G-protein coupled receptors family 1 profile domain-containing protein n=1 Tax=Pinctada imbricata TaxID=66713 RepID=A0AA88YP57_PINIB|nr:hypothetical protein FSP39_000670 [Pinctada imbricata]